MKFDRLLILIIIITSCTSEDELRTLRSEKLALQQKVASLELHVSELTKNPDDQVKYIKGYIEQGDLLTAKNKLDQIRLQQFNSRQLIQINKLLSTVNSKLEQNGYRNLSMTDTSLYHSFINNYPKSKYSGQLKQRLKKLRKESYRGQYSITKTYRPKKSVQNYGRVRVGAICCDGTRSYATGRGACSHHGGVCQWLYR